MSERFTLEKDSKVDARPVLVSDFSEADPPIFDIPAMICQPEKNFYYWLTSNHAPGVGAVVELGTWLGSSTAYLSAGLNGRPIHCYDWFRWSALDNWKSNIQLEDGADFSELFIDNMERCGANVIVHCGKIEDFTWDGSPIELLIIDMGKLAFELASLLTTFAPGFIPGQTQIVLQDYQYFPGYQISLVMDAIRSSAALECVVSAKDNKQPNAVSFLVVAPIDVPAMNEAANTFKTWSVEQILATWARITKPLPDKARARLAPGLALFLYDAGHKAEAVDILGETPMDQTMKKRWKRMATYPDFSSRYPALFSLPLEASPST